MRRALPALLIFLLLAASTAVKTPAAYDLGVIEASSAHTTSASSAITLPVANCSRLVMQATVTAGSGTVTEFKIFARGSNDNVTFFALPALSQIKDNNGATPIPSGTMAPYLVAETAVVNQSAVYTAIYELAVDYVKVGWVVVGTTPSETFSVRAGCQ